MTRPRYDMLMALAEEAHALGKSGARLPEPMLVSQIVDRLGGPCAVSRKLNATPSAVSMWQKQNGIPPHQWQAVHRLLPDLSLIQIAASLTALEVRIEPTRRAA